jgi:hypothetical protein
MMRAWIVVASLVLPVAALAQGAAPITATPLLPPPQMATPQPAPDAEAPPPPASDQTQAQPAPEQQPQQQSLPSQDATTQEGTPPAPQPMQLTWVPQGAAQLQVLDKVNAQSTTLTVKVGQQGQYGSLTIQVQACDTHPPDVPQDAAAYLKITDSHSDAPGFQGWMLSDNPSVSMLQNSVYDVRVVGCQA